jgi:hypothetical protein
MLDQDHHVPRPTDHTKGRQRQVIDQSTPHTSVRKDDLKEAVSHVTGRTTETINDVDRTRHQP